MIIVLSYLFIIDMFVLDYLGKRIDDRPSRSRATMKANRPQNTKELCKLYKPMVSL